MDQSRLEFLFERFRSGACTEKEKHELMEIISRNDTPAVRKFLSEVWNAPAQKLAEDKSQQILNSILGRRDHVIPIRNNNYLWARAAAITAFIAISTAIFYLTQNARFEKTTSDITAEALRHDQFLKLPDGSKVILNQGSKLEYSDSFAGKHLREVYLTGEAFFDIVHDASRPFVVRTGRISTTVLGTAFNVKAYPEQNDITVTVARGKVSVSDDVKLLGILLQDDQITFNKNSQETRRMAVRSNEIITWTEKDIFFDDVSMFAAAEELEARFDVGITFKNERIKECKFTATFIRGEDLLQILDVICEFNSAKYKVNASGEIEIFGDGCPPKL